MLSRPQIITIKRAQKDAGLDDVEYRDCVATVSGIPDCRSSTDKRLTDEHFDKLMKWFEALYWAIPDAARSPSEIFRFPHYWTHKNQRGNTSRDRHISDELDAQITALEDGLAQLGFGQQYCSAIQNRLRSNAGGNPFRKTDYLGALTRTLKAKQHAAQAKEENVPF